MKKREVLIIGGGPGGTATALYFVESGIKPLITEQPTFPRFDIGESLRSERGKVIHKRDHEAELTIQHRPIKYAATKRRLPLEKNSWSPARLPRRASHTLTADQLRSPAR